MIRKILMLVTVLVLLCLVLVSPLFLDSGEGPITIPRLLIDHAEEETRIYVGGAVETYRYPYITIEVRDLEGSDWNKSTTSNDTIHLTLIVEDADTTHFQLNVTLMRGEKEYVYDCTIEVDEDEEGKEVLRFLFPDEELPIERKEDSFPFRDVIVKELETQ
ncbi:MAG: hypothetical protein E3J35_07880 [Methanomassiliicoccales archaeon]|nr:MAG: hypothetical protein E3J35_07880 [Methanomassiliicoccales archaeon]